MNVPAPVLITTREVAERLGVSVRSLEEWRKKKIGPAWVEIGPKAVRYELAVVEQFIADKTVRPEPK